MGDPTGRISHLPDMHRGVSWKQPCRVATTASVTIATALNAGDTIDGVTLAAGDRVLVKNQGTGSQNGIYIAGASPVRAFDMDQDTGDATAQAEEVAGAYVHVLAGTANAGTLWRTTNVAGATLGTTSIVWEEFAGSVGTGDMEKATYDTDNDGMVDLAEALRTSEIDVYSDTDDKCLNIRARDANAYTRVLVQPHGMPTGGDTAIHLYYDRQAEGSADERFLGIGATHGGNFYSIASGDATGGGSYLPILFYMEDASTVLEVMRLNTDRSVEFWKHLLLREISAPSTPASGLGALYPKTDGRVYFKNDAGTEYDLTGTGVGALDDLSDVTISSAATGDILRHNGTAFVDVNQQDAGRWEVVMTGSAGTLEAVTNEAEDDWLYGWVA